MKNNYIYIFTYIKNTDKYTKYFHKLNKVKYMNISAQENNQQTKKEKETNEYQYILNNTIISTLKKSHNYCNKLLHFVLFLCVTGIVANEK